ncbi:ATP synthase subunit d, mitochondrial-like [Phlebotomus papatasi]|uniref:ATP synthase subunit d, mitochondrial-like n=1 Tax=Phlebotomus papatasi TaxID=29031 RepID=UPI0024840C80|nr:ATP synthase subunit d, mitochondrial-like [Phlebotomus papatasi]
MWQLAQHPNFIAFKPKSDKYLWSVQANPEQVTKIDSGAHYKQAIPVAGLVDSFQKQEKTLKEPYPEDTFSADVKSSRISSGRFRCSRGCQMRGLLNTRKMEDFHNAYFELAIDPLNKLIFWPHNPEDQLEYMDKDAPESSGCH